VRAGIPDLIGIEIAEKENRMRRYAVVAVKSAAAASFRVGHA